MSDELIYFQNTGCIPILEAILNIVTGTKVNILVENTAVIMGRNYDSDSAINLARFVNHENLKVCLDTCHIGIVAKLFCYDYNYLVKYFSTEDVNVKQIHFNSLSGSDGVKDKNTHSTPHTKQSLVADLQFLKDIGIVTANLVTEISEDDYANYPNTVKQLELVTTYLEEV